MFAALRSDHRTLRLLSELIDHVHSRVNMSPPFNRQSAKVIIGDVLLTFGV